LQIDWKLLNVDTRNTHFKVKFPLIKNQDYKKGFRSLNEIII